MAERAARAELTNERILVIFQSFEETSLVTRGYGPFDGVISFNSGKGRQINWTNQKVMND